eukprot:TRINITY_DN2035_c0_g1_i1.p1 TRINITY_DN2035_c0_g1~~TRINITY_DN2035_c0_g1_i1.p1  ORF type:complete len:417 (-),score=74.49 TRINITY_DN2035_c0_g1_i1:628-1878(-)
MLVCGRYFQGRGTGTQAHLHSLEVSHHIFINLHDQRVFCLPDNYEVIDASLMDIKYNLCPVYTPEEVARLDANTQPSRALDGTKYLPGCIGLNNIKYTDYVNVVIQALCRIPSLRDFLIHYEKQREATDVLELRGLLTKRFAELVRKIWNPRNFKGQVSPHEFLQAITLKSAKRFKIGEQSDPANLLAWLLETLHDEITTLKGGANSIINECFQGAVEIETYEPGPGIGKTIVFKDFPNKIEIKKFRFLSLELPPPPLFKDASEKSIIPQISLFDVLAKFDGQTFQDTPEKRFRHRLRSLPKYLVLHFRRFTRNNFFVERNPTIVAFPLKNLNMAPYLIQDPLAGGKGNPPMKYNLLATICHEGEPKSGRGIYKLHVLHKALNSWFEIQDLHIREVMPEQVSVSESYILFYERIDE